MNNFTIKISTIIAAVVLIFTMNAQVYAEGNYQVVDPSELSFTVKTESVFFTDGGRKIVGTIKALYCEGHEIELVTKEIQDGFIDTKKYGKIMISPPPNLSTPYLPISVTPEQKKELLKLKKQ